ncbi:MAG: hypothetical protein E7666_02955 [Ruminococcaceae bacterium]|nr:hypothetical protein [Oscillospiraceae bacterium]
MKKGFRIVLQLLLALCLLPLIGVSVHAEEASASGETDRVPSEFSDLLEVLPEELLELLPDGIFSQNTSDVGEAARQMSDFSYLLSTLLSLIGLNLGSCAKMLASVCGLLLLSAILRIMRTSIGNERLGAAFSLCSTLAITLALLRESYLPLADMMAYFQMLGNLTLAAIPLMGALYAMGGNVSAAVASSGGLAAYMTVLEQLVGKSILPFCGICMAFALVRALDPSIRLGALSNTVKKQYSTALGFLMMLLLAMLAAQTTLGAKGDSLTMRSVKFAAGNLIPVVGGSVSELLRTLSAGIGYLRGTVGICATLLLLLTLLPTLIELLLLRGVWQLAASFADLLGCENEKKLLDEFASLLGYLIAAVSICSSVPLLSVTLLSHCASAIG